MNALDIINLLILGCIVVGCIATVLFLWEYLR